MEVLYRLKGNEPLLLNNPDKIWILQNGSIAVFATYTHDGFPIDGRHYLFTVESGEALFGFPINKTDAICLLAVALETSELSSKILTEFIKESEEDKVTNLAESWIHNFSNTFNQRLNKEYLVSELGDDLLLFKSTGVEELIGNLASFHEDFCRYFHWLQQQETEIGWRQFEAREQLNRQVVKGALTQLGTVLQPQQQPVELFSQNTPILVAMGAVGRAMEIKISPPPQSDNFSRVKDPVEAIARASQIRTRRITLENNWWQKEHGPLLAYTKVENHPVALLPTSGSRYLLFNPVLGTRIPVNKTIAATLAAQGYTFYRPLPRVVKKVLELFRFSIKGYEKDIIHLVAVGIIGTLLGMVVPQGMRILIDNAIPDSDELLIWQLGLAMFALAFGQSAFSMSQGIISLRVESAADSTLQPAIWDRLLRLSPSFFREYSAGDLANRALTVSAIRQKISSGVQRTLLSALFALLNLALMLIYNWQLALVGIAISFVAAFITLIFGAIIVSQSRIQQEIDGELSGLVVQLINGVAKLRVAMAENQAFATWAEKYSQRIHLKAIFQQINDGISVFNEVLPLISAALLYWFAITFMEMAQAKQLMEGASNGNPSIIMTAGSFLAFYTAFGIFLKGVIDLSNTLTDIVDIVPMWERANPILNAQPEYNPDKADSGNLQGYVALDKISFSYHEGGSLVLNNISLHANPGEFIAIIGPSGSGKSTIMRLLLGFETPTAGKVSYDGKDLAELDLQSVRRQLGVVLQNGRINSGSIFLNITAGALITQEEAWEAARRAGFAEDIEQMPMGMHTVISEGGTNISGGQRQRLLIARALVLKPKIILLDEATSALDNRIQEVVTDSLNKLQATRIVIAHRLSTIRNANRIYLVADGEISQVGTFDELLGQEGLFARLVTRQME
jgi:NHLM bacteriocin system ABC transporter ATP-binding protein